MILVTQPLPRERNPERVVTLTRKGGALIYHCADEAEVQVKLHELRERLPREQVFRTEQAI